LIHVHEKKKKADNWKETSACVAMRVAYVPDLRESSAMTYSSSLPRYSVPYSSV